MRKMKEGPMHRFGLELHQDQIACSWHRPSDRSPLFAKSGGSGPGGCWGSRQASLKQLRCAKTLKRRF